ncbi:MAG: tetratricopeptide repeat protein, partial [Hyphomicrobiales bacterium]
MSNLIRCIEGHVYDRDEQEACPVCGAVPKDPAKASARTTARTSPGPKARPKSAAGADKGPALATGGSRTLVMGAGALALVLAVGVWALWPGDDGPGDPGTDQEVVQNEGQGGQDAQQQARADEKKNGDGQKEQAQDEGTTGPGEGEKPLSERQAQNTPEHEALTRAFDTKNYAEAWKLAESLAARNDPEALFIKGKMLHLGLGIQKSPAEAAALYRKAAELGDPRAMNNLGHVLLRGDGVERNDVEAADWFRKCALSGHVTCENNYGWVLQNGRGVVTDKAAAVEWFTKAADKGYIPAQMSLTRM